MILGVVQASINSPSVSANIGSVIIQNPVISEDGNAAIIEVVDNFVLKPNTLHYVNSDALIQLYTPLEDIPDSKITIVGVGTGLFKINQKEGDQIKIGDTATTIGLSGSIASMSPGDIIEFSRFENIYIGHIKQGFFEII
jgi:hypothetical protein